MSEGIDWEEADESLKNIDAVSAYPPIPKIGRWYKIGPIKFTRYIVPCRVYWGSHGCTKKRGHLGKHKCIHGCPRNYGPDTHFYGDDAVCHCSKCPS